MASAAGFATPLRVPSFGSDCLRSETASVSYVSPSSPRNRFLERRSKISRLISRREGGLRTRCEASSEHLAPEEKIESRVSSLSAIEQLKFSAADRYTKERSSIVAIGFSVHTAPVELREKLAIPEAQWPQAIRELSGLNHIEEAAIISTCNRIEIYVVALSQRRGVIDVNEWMSKACGIPVSELSQNQFLLYNNDAARHLFEVSAGLDSVVIGEGQILAQVKQVVKSGQGVPGFGLKISGLFKRAITAGKRVRTETNIASGAVSVSSAAVELGLLKLPASSYEKTRVLVVGAGKMGKLVIKHLVAKGCTKMVVINRTENTVAALREEHAVQIIYRPLPDIIACAAESDVIFTCTASEKPLLSKSDVETLPPPPAGHGRRRLFVDLSVPRNVDPGVCVFNVDDLREAVEANREERAGSVLEARAIIDEEMKQFEAWKDSLETVPTIKKLRAYAERIRASEVEKCLARLGGGGSGVTEKEKRAVYELSVGIVNKLLHGPMRHLRCDGSGNRSLGEVFENMEALNRIFGLEAETSELEEKLRSKIEQSQK